MSKRNYTVDTEELKRIRKQADKINKILEKSKKLKAQLNSIKENERWLRYLGKDSTITLTDEQNWEFNELTEKIIYAEV